MARCQTAASGTCFWEKPCYRPSKGLINWLQIYQRKVTRAWIHVAYSTLLSQMDIPLYAQDMLAVLPMRPQVFTFRRARAGKRRVERVIIRWNEGTRARTSCSWLVSRWLLNEVSFRPQISIYPRYTLAHLQSIAGKDRPRPAYSYSSDLLASAISLPFQANNVSDNWVTVPTNSTLTIHKQTVMIHPIIDQYYNHSPSYVRSSGFVVSQGLVSGAAGDGADADRKEDAKEFGTREGGNKENLSLADSDRAGLRKFVRKELVNGMNGG